MAFLAPEVGVYLQGFGFQDGAPDFDRRSQPIEGLARRNAVMGAADSWLDATTKTTDPMPDQWMAPQHMMQGSVLV